MPERSLVSLPGCLVDEPALCCKPLVFQCLGLLPMGKKDKPRFLNKCKTIIT